MKDSLNKKELLELLKDFYLLTKIKIVLFDANYEEILAYPDTHCGYCRQIRNSRDGLKRCIDSNIRSFKHCERTRSLTIYHCHAGLVEATAPLIDNGVLIGYIMFGQITDMTDPQMLQEVIQNYLTFDLNTTSDLQKPPSFNCTDIVQKTPEEIAAAAKIMEACTLYVLFRKLLQTKRQNFVENINNYISGHLSEDLTVDTILEEFHISRSHLYRVFDKYVGTSIADYIKLKRLEKAKALLIETTLPISRIAAETGFSDYNYFCRVFKKEAGCSAKKYRALATPLSSSRPQFSPAEHPDSVVR